ncbi:MAG TPA: SAM-dependent methyltransferase, partial [Opitutaceae bacterium]|nr:SAM-dependent methyltransferase [Opitutaceae bacterium]
MQSNPNQEFLDRIRASLDQQAFIKLTLGKPRGVEASLEKILVRLIELQGAPLLSFVYRHKTHDITKNFSLPEGLSLINSYLGSQFHSGHLFTADRDVQFEINKKGEPRLTSSKPTSTPAPTRAHDDAKQRSIPLDRPWLQLLGVTRSDGRVREGMAAKFRQINKFVELLSHLCNETPLSSDRPLSIVDMGSGKGYLTFATYDYFTNVAKRSVTLRGIELRPELVELCNKTAYASGFSALHFDAGTIAENHAANPIDILIALHACDTATDDALFQGLKAGASLLVVSPCCQKELRSQL